MDYETITHYRRFLMVIGIAILGKPLHDASVQTVKVSGIAQFAPLVPSVPVSTFPTISRARKRAGTPAVSWP